MRFFHHPSVRRFTFVTMVSASLLSLLALLFYAVLWFHEPSASHNQSRQLQALAQTLERQLTTSVHTAQRNYLRTTAANTLASLRAIDLQAKTGALSQDEARWLARTFISSAPSPPNTYSFAYDERQIIRAHPIEEMLGSTLDQRLVDMHGQHAQKSVYTFTDRHDEADSGIPVAMLGYSTVFSPWQWHLVTAIPLDNATAFISLQDIRSMIEQSPLYQDYQVVVFFKDGTIWTADPDASADNPATMEEYSALTKTLWARKNGLHTYKWIDAQNSTPLTRNIAYREIHALNLIVAVSAEHMPSALTFIVNQNGLPAAVLLTLLTIGLIGFLASRLLSRPIVQLSRELATCAAETHPSSIPGWSPREIQRAGHHFNTVVEQLLHTQQQLNEEQRTSETVYEQLRSEIVTRKETHQKLLAEISTRKSAENYLQLFKNIFDHAIEGIIITDNQARILTVNQSFTDITGYLPDEVIGKNPSILSSGQQSENFYRKMWQSLEEKGSWFGEIVNRKKDGTICPEWLSISQLKDSNNRITHYFAFFHDITELKEKEKQISFMAYRDALTLLPNRAALEARLAKAISKAKREGSVLAVLFIDLDNFKNINDTLGHDKGDEVLIQVAERINQTIRNEDTLSRLGGDEFILLSESIENESGIFHLASRILACLKEPFTIGFSELFINASIGIATYPNDGKNTNELIKNADMAMYRAKNEGKNKFVLFTQEMHENFLTHVRIENSIRTGLLKREFIIYYQPKIEISTQKVTSFEALIRWNKNGLIIGPDKFIPVAEESGLIDKMSLYVLEEVCTFLNKLQAKHLRILPVSVNMAPRTFNNLEIVETIDDILDKHNIDHKYIEFEITETTAMQDIQHTLSTMHRFRQRGINFSIDDFGTGYSSLSYLSEMPVSTLKIDKRFVNAEDNHSRSIVSTITAMSRQMQLKVVAEGVETAEQLEWLRTLGCNEAQGYYFARPMPEQETVPFFDQAALPLMER